MAFLWLDSVVHPHLAEYARAYERAIKSGSIDSVISWELGGFRCEDGTLINELPDAVRTRLKNDSLYTVAINQVENAVKSLREARYISELSTQLHS